MFIDNEQKNNQERFSETPDTFNHGPNKFSTGKIYVYLIYILIFVAVISVFYYFYSINQSRNDENSTQNQQNLGIEPEATSTEYRGFQILVDGNGDVMAIGSSTDLIKAEYLSFGNFYERPKDDFRATISSFELPINVKTDVSNYYEASRKINLDPYIDDLNNYGFAVIDNQFIGEANDFFGMNRLLSQKGFPVIATTDFLFYYFQNTLKQAFKEIEENAFYENVWTINKKLYDDALTRYKLRANEKKMINDPILEAERLETAYLAVVLKLLMPMSSQINENTNLNEKGKFTKQEAEKFVFDIPSFLIDDVATEINLIREAKKESKSPVMLYGRDYKSFLVPADYKNNAKLNNFYLAMKWANSVFPLYYKSETCPNCLLDKDDWTINLIAASYLSKDFSQNQEVKNQWAICYKFISFFSGLRDDLTYLHNNEVMSGLFGENYVIEDIFAADNPKRDENIASVQKKLAEYDFKDIEGGLPRDIGLSVNEENAKYVPYIGMRILQEPYWPNGFIFDELTGEDLSTAMENQSSESSCSEKDAKGNKMVYRCKGTGLDLVNILYEIESPADYFIRNTDYNNYGKKINELKNKIAVFNDFTWNDNIYWASLDLGRKILQYNQNESPTYSRSLKWEQEKNYNSFLGSWVNIHLPADKLEFYGGEEAKGLSAEEPLCNHYNYIEPNLALYKEMLARNVMLIDILSELGVSKEANDAVISLTDFNKYLNEIIKISKKELSNEVINEEDCNNLNLFLKLRFVEKSGEKTYEKKENLLNEKIDGVKLIAVVYEKEGKKILAVGPIFDYRESDKLQY
ncbi:MAG: DUF3160 domain-containing protein [bacterium]